MGRRGIALRPDFTREELLAVGLTDADASEVLAFRTFLGVLNDAPVQPDGKKHVGADWLAYAAGEISGAQLLGRLEAT